MQPQKESSPQAKPDDLTELAPRESADREVKDQETRDFFARAAASHDEKVFTAALAAVPDAPPLPGDEMR